MPAIVYLFAAAMQKLISLLLFVMLSPCSFADTTWLNKKWRKADKDSAMFFSLLIKKDDIWNQQIFFSKNAGLYMDGYFLDSPATIKTGSFKWYNLQGVMTDSIVYYKGIALYTSHFHDNGKKKTILVLDSSGIATYINSWDKNGNETYADTFYHDWRGCECHKDTASMKGIINKEDEVWRLRFYNAWNDSLFTTGYFKERLCKTRGRYGSWYNKGLLRDSAIFDENGKRKAVWHFHNNGIKNAYRTFDSSGTTIIARNWDEEGNEIKVDSSLKYAMPVEGYKSWQRKILKQINNDNTIDWQYRKNLYGSVYISFIIDEIGNLTSTFIKEHSLYPGMDSIILNACKENQSWKPCTYHGRKSMFFGVHSFSFVAGKVIKYKTLY